MPLPRELARRDRLIMTLARRGVPGVPVLGRYNNTRANSPLAVHAHPGQIEICYLVRGSQNYRLGGRDYRLRGGDVFISFPGERHSTGDEPEEKGVLYWMTVRPRAGSFLGLPPTSARALGRALRDLQRRSRLFRGSRRMQSELDAMTALYHAPAYPLKGCSLLNCVAAFLLEVVACGRRDSSASVRGPLPAQVQHLVRGWVDRPITVPMLAAECGLSVPRFKVRFKEEAGVPPAEFVLRLKIAEARRRLGAGGATVTEIAYALGFSSSQYFATVFRRFTGRSPRDERPCQVA